MARRRTHHKFTGDLATPIVRRINALRAGMPTSETEEERVFDAQLDKMFALARHYGLPEPSTYGALALLVIRLGENFVPGFRVVETAPRGRGRPSNIDAYKVWREVKALLAAGDVRSNKSAFERIAHRTCKDVATIARQFYSVQKHMSYADLQSGRR